jgi:GNAT superfamily N-acetyltransferase
MTRDLHWQVKHEFVWVLLLSSCVEGFAHLRPLSDSSSAYVHAFYLTPVAAGRGHGRAFLRYLEDFSRRTGFASLSLHSSVSALPFYRRAGFSPSGPASPTHLSSLSLPSFPLSKPLTP